MSDAQGRSPFCQRTPPSGISDREHGLSFGTESEGHQGPFSLSQVLTVVAGLGGGRCWVGSTMGPRWVCEDVSPGRGAAGPPRQHLVRFVGPFCHSQVAILGMSEVGCHSSRSSLRSCRTPPWAGDRPALLSASEAATPTNRRALRALGGKEPFPTAQGQGACWCCGSRSAWVQGVPPAHGRDLESSQPGRSRRPGGSLQKVRASGHLDFCAPRGRRL